MGEIVPLHPASVLVVDDEPLVARAMGLMLEDLWDVAVVTHAGRAWERLAEQPWTVLVTDLEMPVRTGPELAVRARALWPGIRVVLVSGDHRALSDAAWVAQALVGKPFLPDVLIRAVQGERPAVRRRSTQG